MTRLDPDALAYLEEEREFLLGSLDDLEREYAAGDVDDSDYEELRDSYTKRAADVIRSIESEEAQFEAASRPSSWSRRALAVGAVAIVALVAGLVLARAVGFRSPTDSATGDIRQSNRTVLLEAQAVAGSGDYDAAIELYDQVLAQDPSSAEALTYRGWSLWQLGEGDAAVSALADGVAADPEYADARVFSAVVATNEGRYDDAAVHLVVFDSVEPPQVMVDLVEGSGVRAEVLAGLIAADYSAAESEEPVDLDRYDTTLAVAAAAGRVLDSQGELVLATKVHAAVLVEDPDNTSALVARGARLASPQFAEFPEIVDEGLMLLDRAVDLEPENPEALFWRAVALAGLGRAEAALADLDAFEALTDQPRELLDLVDQVELRRQIEDLLN
jgi:tetratricopeptide (TPR) repeat protein